MAWMRTAALPNFRKLWGRIDTTFPAGSTLQISMSQPVQHIQIWRPAEGGVEHRLPGCRWQERTFWALCTFWWERLQALSLVLLFFILHTKFPRKLGNAADLSWNREQR